ncbi:Alpha/beta hydrolase fold-1 [Trinorchestia longiramus]|nr:Alpha/beta hydrolase fold-1 [Trinorchestia longiramus]
MVVVHVHLDVGCIHTKCWIIARNTGKKSDHLEFKSRVAMAYLLGFKNPPQTGGRLSSSRPGFSDMRVQEGSAVGGGGQEVLLRLAGVSRLRATTSGGRNNGRTHTDTERDREVHSRLYGTWCSLMCTRTALQTATYYRGVKSVEQETYVDIGPIIDPAGDRVLTLQANLSSPRTPLLLVHGFGCGSGLWCNNIDALAKDRPVYAIDLVGFGRSSRPNFSSDPFEVEAQFVSTIEAWRKTMGLQKFYLCGHSFGGYLCTLYSMQHPTRVEHLILVDPWGFPSRPPDYRLPVWMLPIEVGAGIVLPFFALRAAGPLGYLYLRLIPPFNTNNFSNINNPRQVTTDYFYHVNVKKPSGEKAFHSLMSGIAWAKFPMMPRLGGLRKEVPITFLYGEKTWVWKRTGTDVQKLRSDSYVDVQIVAAAGHAVGSDQPAIFNAIVNRVLKSVDVGETPRNPLTEASQLASHNTENVSASTNNRATNSISNQTNALNDLSTCDSSPVGGEGDLTDCDASTFRDVSQDFEEDSSSPSDSGLGSVEDSHVRFECGDDEQFYDTSEDPATDSLSDDIEELTFLSAEEHNEGFAEDDSTSDTPRSILTQIAELISPNSLDSSSIEAMNSRKYPNFMLPTKLGGLYIDPKEAVTRLQRYMEMFMRRR